MAANHNHAKRWVRQRFQSKNTPVQVTRRLLIHRPSLIGLPIHNHAIQLITHAPFG